MTQAPLCSRNGSFIQGLAKQQAYSHELRRTFSDEPGIMQMRNKLTLTPQQPSVYDYSASVAKAVEWLGDRYLLAKPIKVPRPAHEHTSRMSSCSIDCTPTHRSREST